MSISRRKILQSGALMGVAGLAPGLSGVAEAQRGAQQSSGAGPLPSAFDWLKPLGDRVRPITVDEFQERIAHAQKLMTDLQPDFAALYLAPGRCSAPSVPEGPHLVFRKVMKLLSLSNPQSALAIQMQPPPSWQQ